MKPIVGIICEYDPFHRGHARQFALIREELPDAQIVCVMSGCFTQRGMPSLFSPAFRANAALQAGASAVLELPCAFAVRDAENFALGGVDLLTRLGCVTHLSFGCETADLCLLTAIAALLENPTVLFNDVLRQSLAKGMPFAASQAAAILAALTAGNAAAVYAGALAACSDGAAKTVPALETVPATGTLSHARPITEVPASGHTPAELAALLAKPNNILGVCYLRALMRLNSPIKPLPVPRVGAYHADTLADEGFPSAMAARKAFCTGHLAAAEAACGYQLAGAPFHSPNALDAVLLYRLRTADAQSLRQCPDCSEGLENRLTAASRDAVSRAALLAMLKTRRYTYARLNRLATHALLNVTTDLLAAHPSPEYARLLGFRRESADCLRLIRRSGFSLVAKAADGDRANPLWMLDERAYDLWALGAGLPAGLMFRQPIVLV